MTFSFKKGKYRARPLYWLHWFPLLIRPREIRRSVIFNYSTKYDLGTDDQYDVLKLFGYRFGFRRRDSARFGWRFEPKVNKFFLYAYTYVNGVRSFEKVCECVANFSYECTIIYYPGCYYLFTVKNEKGIIAGKIIVQHYHKKKIAWLLGPYFGGTTPAPHDMTLTVKK